MSGKELLDLPLLEIRDWIETHINIPCLGLKHVNMKQSKYKKRLHKLTEVRLSLAEAESDTIHITIYRGEKVIRGQINIRECRVDELTRWRLAYSYVEGGRKRYACNILLEEYTYDREEVLRVIRH